MEQLVVNYKVARDVQVIMTQVAEAVQVFMAEAVVQVMDQEQDLMVLVEVHQMYVEVLIL